MRINPDRVKLYPTRPTKASARKARRQAKLDEVFEAEKARRKGAKA